MNEESKWWSWRGLRNLLIQGFIISIVLIGVILLIAAINRVYGNNPPISVVSLDPKNIGEFCPGEKVLVHNQIEIASPTVVVYALSTMDINRHYNILGTTTIYASLPHPVADITFRQEVEWTVPDIAPGNYSRVFSARGHDPEEKPAFVWSLYTIKKREQCRE